MANPIILMINVGQEQSEEESPLERALRSDDEENELMHILKMMLAKMPSSTHIGGGGGN
jgi:hypothetical protein